MIRFLNYLDTRVPAGERPYDRIDAKKHLDAARNDLGTRSCRQKPPEPEPVAESSPQPAPTPAVDIMPPPPQPAPRRGLKISGWTLFALGLGLGAWSSAELAFGELNERGRQALIAFGTAITQHADEIAALCGFLCSERAGYITNQSLAVDGGLDLVQADAF